MESPDLKLATIELPVRDLARAVSWYQRALGCHLKWSDESHALLGASSGVDFLLVCTSEAGQLSFRSSVTGVHHGVVDFRTSDLEALHAHLRAAGGEVEPLGPPSHDWAPRGFAFSDPDGNRFGAFAY